jgi:hypothetical protein
VSRQTNNRNWCGSVVSCSVTQLTEVVSAPADDVAVAAQRAKMIAFGTCGIAQRNRIG